ncbi:hypothetical protein ISS37_06010 [candidate division KSB1 bacterium]|nr:hypothetical protein [candidate division KSB1 bacterium]
MSLRFFADHCISNFIIHKRCLMAIRFIMSDYVEEAMAQAVYDKYVTTGKN